MGALEDEEAESMVVDPAGDGEPTVAQGSVQGPIEGAWEDPMARVRALLGGSRQKLKITTVGDKVVLEPEPEKKPPVVEGVTMGKQLQKLRVLMPLFQGMELRPGLQQLVQTKAALLAAD